MCFLCFIMIKIQVHEICKSLFYFHFILCPNFFGNWVVINNYNSVISRICFCTNIGFTLCTLYFNVKTFFLLLKQMCAFFQSIAQLWPFGGVCMFSPCLHGSSCGWTKLITGYCSVPFSMHLRPHGFTWALKMGKIFSMHNFLGLFQKCQQICKQNMQMSYVFVYMYLEQVEPNTAKVKNQGKVELHTKIHFSHGQRPFKALRVKLISRNFL